MENEVDARERRGDVKRRLAKVRGNVSSRKSTAVVVDLEDAE